MRGAAGKCRQRPTQGLLLLRRRQRRTQRHRACQLRVVQLVLPSLPQLLNLPRCGRLCEEHLELGAAPIIQNRSVECLHGSRCAGGPVKLDIAHLNTTDRGDSGRRRESGAPQMRSKRSGGMVETLCIHSQAPTGLGRNLPLISLLQRWGKQWISAGGSRGHQAPQRDARGHRQHGATVYSKAAALLRDSTRKTGPHRAAREPAGRQLPP